MTTQNVVCQLDTVMALEPDAFARARLATIFRGSRWKLVVVESLEEARQLLVHNDYVAVIAGFAHGADLRALVGRLGRNARIVAVADFAEALDPGTQPSWIFSLLRRPYAANEVLQTVNFAWAAARWNNLTLNGWLFVA